MPLSEPDVEKKFLSDMEKATALSLESHAMEEFRQRKASDSRLSSCSQGPAHKGALNDILVRSIPADSAIKARPRPAPSITSACSNTPIRPPPPNPSSIPRARSLQTDLITWTGTDASDAKSATVQDIKSTVEKLFSAQQRQAQHLQPRRSSSSSLSCVGSGLGSSSSVIAGGGHQPLSLTFVPNRNASHLSGTRAADDIKLPVVPRMVFSGMGPLKRLNYDASPSTQTPLPVFKTGQEPLSWTMSDKPADAMPCSWTPFRDSVMTKSQSLTNFPSASASNLSHAGRHFEASASASCSPVHTVSAPCGASMASSPIKRVVPKTKTKSSCVSHDGSLIDFGDTKDDNRRRIMANKVNVLEAFDPLYLREMAPDQQDENQVETANVAEAEQMYFSSSLSEASFYETYDPFEYMVAKAQAEDPSDSVKSAEASSTSTSTRPAKKHVRHLSSGNVIGGLADQETIRRRTKQKEQFYFQSKSGVDQADWADPENMHVQQEQNAAKVDSEVRAFVNMVASVRMGFRHDDPTAANPGIVESPKISTRYDLDTSIKLVIKMFPDFTETVKFTCEVTSKISHVVWAVLSHLNGGNHDKVNDCDFVFGVPHLDEFIMDMSSRLEDYDYVHQCYKFDQDVELLLIPATELPRPLIRTELDDKNDTLIRPEDISPLDAIKTLSFDDLNILLDTLDKESARMIQAARILATGCDKDTMTALRPKQVLQAVKAVCTLLGRVETTDMTEMCNKLVSQCLKFDQAQGSESGPLRPEILEEVCEKYATVVMTTISQVQMDHAKQIKKTLSRIKDTVHKLAEVYAKTFRVNYSFTSACDAESLSSGPSHSVDVLETLLIRVCALHRLQPDWHFDDYSVMLQIFHGTRPITQPLESQWKVKSESFFERVEFDSWLETIQICNLPREARLVLSITGRKSVTMEKQTTLVKTDLGWAALQLFNFERLLAQGTFLLPLWPSQDTEKQVGPAPDSGSHPMANACPVISIELPELSAPVVFPETVPFQPPPRLEYNFKELHDQTQQQLLDICDHDIITFTELPAHEREILWEKRYYLTSIAGALPKVLLAAHAWDYASLPSLYGLLELWQRPSPMDILQLFLPCFPDSHVRQVATDWMRAVDCDDLVDFLPQLVESLKHETWSASPLAKLLLQKALTSPRVAHSLYWLLTQSLPGSSPQNTSAGQDEALLDQPSMMKVARYRRRLQMMMRALCLLSGQALRNTFFREQKLIQDLYVTALEVKQSKDLLRGVVLKRQLERINDNLSMNSETRLPLSLSVSAVAVDTQQSSYFPSNTVPLKLMFVTPKSHLVPAIYKVGDDLRQDQLTIQMIRVMDKLWLRDGLDLKMVTFSCVPTGSRQGMVEMVTNAKTLREIQVFGSGRGVTGSFKDTPITEWLEKLNPTQFEFATAVSNFTRSCAGYSVVTYVLGICDRHNDNIMVKNTGHLFHIDFGKFLGDAQMFGSFKRDRVPFVLTPDMMHVINGSDKPTQKYHDFVDLCCRGFNIVRKHGNLLLNLFALMVSSGIPGVSMDAVSYVQRALLPDLSSAEAAATFARMIEESLGSWFTQVNFFIHNLAQLRFGESPDDASQINGPLLSFIPNVYSWSTDGRIETVVVYGIQKRYYPEKHYVFILAISRQGVKAPNYLFRTYKEFCEFASKLSAAFPTRGLNSLPKGLHLGRQEIREVAERRKHDIATFLDTLFGLDESICHSDLVYTFFHPLLRDQEEANIHIRKLKDQQRRKDSSSFVAPGVIKGEIKLSLEYRRNTLMVMVCHAKNLALPDSSKEEPNSYVKLYLHPDGKKETKRKTRIVRRNCHPSFMEMIEYRIPLDIIRCKTLQATVWDADRFQENSSLGGVTIPLEKLDLENKEIVRWYPLTNFHRLSNPCRH